MSAKNYKSNTAFIIFGVVYIYSLLTEKLNPDIVYYTGLFFLIATVAMMLRSNALEEIIKALSSKWSGITK